MKNAGEFKCLRCGWVHAGISETDAITAVADFDEYFATLSLEAHASFGGKQSSLERYKSCSRCGAPAVAREGCTLQVVIAPDASRCIDLED